MQNIGSEDNFPTNLMMELKFEAEHLLSHIHLNRLSARSNTIIRKSWTFQMSAIEFEMYLFYIFFFHIEIFMLVSLWSK